ncbi:MAG TPA: ABC transporter permease [Ohtaekwangia sp.]|uniref:ABC transporter permease n=1 Tax=Ohtaekwangia sp. TaxID=2066019 RepID=UPI002F95E982
MLKNYLRVAIRNLIKQKIYTAINVLGLSIGIASCLLIVIFVTNEFSYDSFHNNAANIYKVSLERKYPNHFTNYAVIPHSYADVMLRDFPEIASAIKMGGPLNQVIVNYKDAHDDVKQFEENFVMAADSNFFTFFSIKLVKGDPQKVLINKTDIVVTEKTAQRYFGKDEPVGKTLRLFNQDYHVTGICEDVPDNSHFKFDFLFKWDDNFFADGQQSNFTTFTAHVYIQLKPGADAKALEAKFPKMVDTYAAAQIENDLGKSWADYKREGNGYTYFLQPLTTIHLDPRNIEAKMQPGGNIHYIYFLIAVAILILVIACINFMNLATARSAERAREVGVRKAMGSLKGQLVIQFLVESIVLSVFATVLALGIALLVLPSFNNLVDKHLIIDLTGILPVVLTGVALLVGFLAGSYPAFALSSFNPVLVMKGNFSSSTRGSWLRNGLVVFQFFISIILIVGTLVVAEQMQYMQRKSLGYDKEQLLIVERAFALQNKTKTFIEEMRRMAEVEKAASSFSLLGRQGDFPGAQFTPEGSSEILTTKSMGIDDYFSETVGFEFTQGHGFSTETNDSLSIILNETAVKTLDIADPVGKKLSRVQRNQAGNVTIQYTIIGIIKDFNFQSLRDPVTPLAIQSNESFGGGSGYIYLRTKGKNATGVIQAAEASWKTLVPDQPFKYQFLDQNLMAQYESEKRAGTVFGIFSGLAIIIACVGLFGLAAYTASLRTKEIGIRKVLGASVGSIVVLLSKDFTRLIFFAFILATPLAWYIMHSWLQGFAYRIELGIGVFILAGITALLIAWITVSYQSIKAALLNPVKSLKSE